MSKAKMSWDIPTKVWKKLESGEYRKVYEHDAECLLMPLADVMDLYEELHQLRKATKRKRKR